jgi:hypothetical protein
MAWPLVGLKEIQYLLPIFAHQLVVCRQQILVMEYIIRNMMNLVQTVEQLQRDGSGMAPLLTMEHLSVKLVVALSTRAVM